MVFTYEYARPALAADIVVFALDALELQVMLIQRGHEPFVGQWALPGGFVDTGESLEDAARRELKEETGISEVFLEQLYTYGKVDRDPRERVVSVAYYALGNLEGHRVKASTDADEAGWFSLNDLPPLAFDHAEILNDALKRLRAKVRYQPLGFELLPDKFPLRVLQHFYEIVLDRKLDKRNFRKKILSMGILEELDEIEKDVSHRAAKLYRFNPEEYERKTQHGFSFEI